MSGSKISVYSLTGRAREIVLGQMQCEQQSLVCFSRIQEILQNLQSFSKTCDQQIQTIQLLAKRTGEGAGQIEKLQMLRKEIETEAADIKNKLAFNKPHISTKYRISEGAYAEKQAELKKLQALQASAEEWEVKREAAFCQDRQNTSKIQDSILQDLFDFNANTREEPDRSYLLRDRDHNMQKIQASIVEDLNGVASFELDATRPDDDFQQRKETVRKELLSLLQDRCLTDAMRGEIQQALSSLQKINTMGYLTTFEAVTVKGIFKKIDAFKQTEAKKREEYKTLCQRYAALCIMAGIEASPLPYSASSAKTMHEEVERLERLVVRQQEQSYISDCVDEVMSDMGYDLIGAREVRKKSGKHFRNELFTFHEGTAVNITFSPDGQISMELGGLAREDRIPNPEETEMLIRDMQTFCSEFEEFEHRMLAKGIVVGNRIALSPPTAEYAAMINVNDYEIDKTTQISVMNTTEKHWRQTEKKVMRRGE